MSDWLRQTADGRLSLTLHIQPGASKTECAGRHGDALKIRLAAPPVDGKANDALIRYLAERLAIPRARITLKSGHSARRKVLEISEVALTAVAALETR